MSQRHLGGIGRIRREPYELWIGTYVFAIEELRNYHVYTLLEPALRALNPPPTAAECLWLISAYGGTRGIFQDGVRLLMELVEPRPDALLAD